MVNSYKGLVVYSKTKGLFVMTGVLLAFLTQISLYGGANVFASENIIECVLDPDGLCNDTRMVLVQTSSDESSKEDQFNIGVKEPVTGIAKSCDKPLQANQ